MTTRGGERPRLVKDDGGGRHDAFVKGGAEGPPTPARRSYSTQVGFSSSRTTSRSQGIGVRVAERAGDLTSKDRKSVV